MSGSSLLTAHIVTGAVALVAGTVAFVVRKGSLSHRRAGGVFVSMMAAMAVTGAYLAFSMEVMLSVIGGLLTLYLVATGWAAVARAERVLNVLVESAALPFALILGGLSLLSGMEAVTSDTGLKDGLPAGQYFMFGGVAVLAAGGDLRNLVKSGLEPEQRVARHLWRMAVAFVIASSAFFLGQARLFPAVIRESHLLNLPVLLPFLLMVYWLLRVLRSREALPEGRDNPNATRPSRRSGGFRNAG